MRSRSARDAKLWEVMSPPAKVCDLMEGGLPPVYRLINFALRKRAGGFSLSKDDVSYKISMLSRGGQVPSFRARVAGVADAGMAGRF